MTTTQVIILFIVSIIFLYAVIDRICHCAENRTNSNCTNSLMRDLLMTDKEDIEAAIEFVKGINGNGNKPV